MDLKVFDFEGQDVRVVGEPEDPWFVAKDICSVLGLSNTGQAMANLDEDEKSSVDPNIINVDVGLGNVFNEKTIGTNVKTVIPEAGKGGKELALVNEPGLYSLILRSRKPEAKEFKRWITHEVIPAVRKYGAYMTPQTAEEVLTDPDNIIKIAQQLKDEQNRRQIAEKRNEELDEHNRELQPKAQYADDVLSSDSLITTKTIAKELGTGPKSLNQFLHTHGVIYKEGGIWHLYYRFHNRGLADYDTYRRLGTDPVTGADVVKTHHHLKWTEKGRKMIHRMWFDKACGRQPRPMRAAE